MHAASANIQQAFTLITSGSNIRSLSTLSVLFWYIWKLEILGYPPVL